MIAWEMDARTRRFLRVSGAAEAVLGYPVHRWRDAPGFWIGVLHPDDRERVARAVWRALRQGGACEIEYRAVAADGTVVELRDRVRVVSDASGEAQVLQGAIVAMAGSGMREKEVHPMPRRWRRSRYSGTAGGAPVVPLPPATTIPVGPIPAATPTSTPTTPPAPATERPAAERVAPPERPPVHAAPRPAPAGGIPRECLIDALGEAVIASDASHRIVYWNAAAEALFGWTAEEVVGRLDSEVLEAKADPGQTAEIVAGWIGRRPWSAEVTVMTRDRQPLPVRITASALRGSDGAPIGYVAVATDLREVRRAARQREVLASMDAVARMARGIALELNEGVNRIEASVRRALARVSASDPSRPQLDEALRTVDATAALAAQLLAVGRDVNLAPEATDLREVVQRGLPALRLLAGDDIEVSTELEAGGRAAWVDPAVASQILLNLAANSCAAMPDGGRLAIATYELDVRRPPAGGVPELPPGRWVVLEVRDVRRRLPAALDRIFEPWSDEVLPPGMGLAAAHGLVSLSGGHLTAAAAPGRGLAFRALFRPADIVLAERDQAETDALT